MNQLRCSKTLFLMDCTQRNEHLWVWGEPMQGELHMVKERMLNDPTFIFFFRDVQTLVSVSCANWIPLHTLEAISCFKRRKQPSRSIGILSPTIILALIWFVSKIS